MREQSEAGPISWRRARCCAHPKSELAGVLLISAETIEVAVALVQNDPGVRAGRLAVEVHPVLLPALEAVRAVYQ